MTTMKVYDTKGRNPYAEIEHIQELLGNIWRGYHPYHPNETDEDGTIVLHVLSKDELETSNRMLANGIRPTLLRQRYEQVTAILEADGYEVEHF